MNQVNKPKLDFQENTSDGEKYSRGHRVTGRYRMYKGDVRTAFTRGILVIIAILLQIFVITLASFYLMQYSLILYFVFEVIGVIFSIYIVYDSESYRYFWPVIILLFPVVGLFLYFVWGSRLVSARSRNKLTKSIRAAQDRLPSGEDALRSLEEKGHGQVACARYLSGEGIPLYRNTEVRYYPLGDDMREDFLADLRSAKSRIWIEFFILLNNVFR